MGLLFKEKELEKEDSVYQRRLDRGEIPVISKQAAVAGNRIRDLQSTIRELTDENSKLRDKIANMQERLDGLNLSLSLEETINGFTEKPQASSFNPFAAFASMKNAASSSASDDAGTRIISDEEMIKIEEFLDGTDFDSEEMELE